MQKVKKYAWIVVATLVIFAVFFGASTKRPSESQSKSFDLEKKLGQIIDGTKDGVDNSLRPGLPEKKKAGSYVERKLKLRLNVPELVETNLWNNPTLDIPHLGDLKVVFNQGMKIHEKTDTASGFRLKSLETVLFWRNESKTWMETVGGVETVYKPNNIPTDSITITSLEADGITVTVHGTWQ